MTLLGRIALGAALGALTTLLLHPVSRPRLFGALANWGPSKEARTAPDLLANLDRLPTPKSISDASLWMEAGARRILSRKPTSKREWDSFIQTAKAGAEFEPDNALWPQMEAVFLLAKGQRSESWVVWKSAAKRLRWDDGQTRRLETVASRLRSAHHEGGWAWISAYGRRSTVIARSLEWFARDLVRSTTLEKRSDLELRYATVMNGRLMREGARSIKVGEVALAVVELGSYPPNLLSISSPKKLLIARAELFHALRNAGWTLQADEVDRAFRDNDGWFGFPTASEAESSAQTIGLGVLIANSVGAVGTIIAAVGAALWGIGISIARTEKSRRPKALPLAVAAGTAAALTWLLTDAWLPTVLIAAAILSLLLSPTNTRSRASVHLGYLHGVALLVTGLSLVSAIAVAVIANVTAGVESLPFLGWASEALDDQRAALVLAVVVLSVVVGMSPAFALVHRFSTLQIIASSAERLGRSIMLGALALLVLAAAPALYVDRVYGNVLSELVNNEPVHYYVND